MRTRTPALTSNSGWMRGSSMARRSGLCGNQLTPSSRRHVDGVETIDTQVPNSRREGAGRGHGELRQGPARPRGPAGHVPRRRARGGDREKSSGEGRPGEVVELELPVCERRGAGVEAVWRRVDGVAATGHRIRHRRDAMTAPTTPSIDANCDRSHLHAIDATLVIFIHFSLGARAAPG